MAARDEQQKIGEGDVVGQPRRERVTLEVVDGDERLPERQGQGLAGRQAHHDATHKPGACRGRDPVEMFELHSGPVQRPLDQAIDDLDMGARGDLRHDAAEGRVVGDLAHDFVRQDFAAALLPKPHHAGSGFIAGRLDAQNAHCTLSPHTLSKVPDGLPSDKTRRLAGRRGFRIAAALPIVSAGNPRSETA